MHLYYIRHGQSENNAIWERKGSSEDRVADPKLTEKGRRQAGLVARFLATSPHGSGRDTMGNGKPVSGRDPQNVGGFPITHCYCSLMERAVATGHDIAQALDLPLVAWIDIHETGGMFLEDAATGERVGQPGLVRSYLEEQYSRIVLPEEATEEGWWNRPFEPREVRQERAERVLETLLARHGDSDDGVVFVSHGGFFNHLLWAILELSEPGPDGGPLWFSANNVSITRIDFDAGRRIVTYLNRVDFLPSELIT